MGEDAVSSGADSMEGDRRLNRAQHRRERKARQTKQVAERKVAKTEARGVFSAGIRIETRTTVSEAGGGNGSGKKKVNSKEQSGDMEKI